MWRPAPDSRTPGWSAGLLEYCSSRCHDLQPAGRLLGGGQSQALAVINTGAQRLPPCLIAEEPFDGPAQAGFEGDLWFPAQIAPDLGCVDGVAQVVARPVSHIGDQVAAGFGYRQHVVQRVADGMDDLQIAALGVATDIVLLADLTGTDDTPERRGMVFDEQ